MDMVGIFESVICITVRKPHDVKMRLITRKNNSTPFIDKMRFVLIEASGKTEL